MPTTVTAYNTFSARTIIESARVNTNFSNHRGDLIPINTDTASSSDQTHDLGSATHRWKDVYGKSVFETVTKTASATLTALEQIVFADITAGAATFTLPTATGSEGIWYTVKKISSDSNTLTVSPSNSETIDGTTTVTITDENDFQTLVSDGTNWKKVAQSGGEAAAGGGGLDVFYTEDFETNKAASFTTGNDSTFLGGATAMAGTLADETGSPIADTTSLKYTMVTASAGDYAASGAITIYEKHQENHQGFTCYYTYDGDDDDIEFVVYDATNAAVLTDSLDVFKSKSSATRGSFTAYIPNGVTSLRWGLHVETANAGKVLVIDEVEGSSNPFISTEIFYSTNLTSYTPTITGFGTPTNVDFTYARRGDMLTVHGKFTSGTTTATEAQLGLPDGLTIDSIKNPTKKIVGYAQRGVVATNQYAILSTGGDSFLNVSIQGAALTGLLVRNGSDIMSNGEVLSFFAEVPITGWVATSEHVITPAKSGIEIFEAGDANGHGDTDNTIRKFDTVLKNTLSSVGSLTNTAANGTYVTALKKCIVIAQRSDRYTASSNQIGWSVNSNQLTTAIQSITKTHRVAYSTSAGSGYHNNTSYVGILEIGDVLRPHDDGNSDVTTTAHMSIVLVDFEQVVLSAVPVQQVAYIKDVKANNTAGGTFTSGAWQTRTLNTLEGDTGFVSLSSNQFTLSAGKYLIEISAPQNAVNRNQVRLRNISDSTNDIIGLSSYNNSSDNVIMNSLAIGTVTIASSKIFEVQHQCATTKATVGFGIAVGAVFAVDNEIYTVVKITKLE